MVFIRVVSCFYQISCYILSGFFHFSLRVSWGRSGGGFMFIQWGIRNGELISHASLAVTKVEWGRRNWEWGIIPDAGCQIPDAGCGCGCWIFRFFLLSLSLPLRSAIFLRPLFNYEWWKRNYELPIVESAFLGCPGSRWWFFIFLRKQYQPKTLSMKFYQLRSSSIKRSFHQDRRSSISRIAALSAALLLYQARSTSIRTEGFFWGGDRGEVWEGILWRKNQ